MTAPVDRSPGRRVAAPSGRLGPLLLTAVAAVALTALALLAQAPPQDQPTPPASSPETRALTSQALGCPAAPPAGGPVLVGSAAEAPEGGSARARAVGDRRGQSLRLAPGGTTTVTVGRATVVQGSGGLAPGLFGARLADGPRPAVGACSPPQPEWWYAGLGAGGTHTSRLELVNPDPGPAVAEVTLWSTDGPLDRIESRGLTVPGRSSAELELAEIAPHRDELVMRLRVERGRLMSSVVDAYAADGTTIVRDWVPASSAPAEELFLPGLPRTSDEHTLTLVNTGDVEGRVSVQVVGRRSTFTPADLPDIRVAPGEVVVTGLTDALAAQLAGEDAALRLESTVPVVAGLRSVVAEDLVHVAAGVPEATDAPRAAALPLDGRSVVVLAGVERAMRVELAFPGADRDPVRLRLRPDVAQAVPVPEGAEAVLVTGSGRVVGGVRTVAPGGAVVTPLRPLTMTDLVPEVRPAGP